MSYGTETEFEKQALKEKIIRYEKVVRDCLKCGVKFEAEGRYNRVCYNCKRGEDYKDDANTLL